MIIQDPIEAKEFFISKIVAEAKRRNEPLTEVEERMLWFTECGSDAKQEYIEAAAEFDSTLDHGSYERKVSDLLRAAYARDLNEAPEDRVKTSRKATSPLATHSVRKTTIWPLW